MNNYRILAQPSETLVALWGDYFFIGALAIARN